MTSGKFWRPPPGQPVKVARLIRVPLCDAEGEFTDAWITVVATDDIGKAITAARRLGAQVLGIYMDPNDSTKPIQLFTAEPVDWQGELQKHVSAAQQARRTGTPFVTAVQQRRKTP